MPGQQTPSEWVLPPQQWQPWECCQNAIDKMTEQEQTAVSLET